MSLVKKIVSRESFAGALTERLAEEFKKPSPGYVEPLISIEKQNHGYDHILVVWRDWDELSTQERSQIIMDAYESAFGLDAALKVTFAWGLTETEKKRMGLLFEPIETKEAAIA